MTRPEHNKTDAGSIGLIVLVILAVIASIVMLISGSANALKLALIAALWAAVLGFFLVVRYRRQAQEAQELLQVERAHRSELAPVAGDVLADIRTELASIREQIEELSGREWVYEPAALHAEARRIQELENATNSAAQNAGQNTGQNAAANVNFTQPSTGAPSADAIAGRLGSQTPRPQANPLDSIINEKMRQHERPAAQQQAPQQSPQPVFGQAPRPQANPQQQFGQPPVPTQQAKAAAQQARPTQPQAVQEEPGAATHRTQQGVPQKEQPAAQQQQAAAQQAEKHSQQEAPSFRTDTFQSVKWDEGGIDKRPHHRHRAPEDESRGRRRSDEKRDGAVSVAELMAAMKKDKK